MLKIQSILKLSGERGIVLNKKKFFTINNFIYLYITILFATVTFFTIYVFRYDVIQFLDKNNLISYDISDSVKTKLNHEFKDMGLSVDNLEEIKMVLQKELPEYTYSLHYEVPYEDGTAVYSLFEANTHYIGKAHKRFDFTLKFQNKNGTVSAYPTYKRFLTVYKLISLGITFILSLIIFYILKKRYIQNAFKKNVLPLFRKINLFSKLSIQLLFMNIFAILTALAFFIFAFHHQYAYFEYIVETYDKKISYENYVNDLKDYAKNIDFKKQNKQMISDKLTNNTIGHAYLHRDDSEFFYYDNNNNSKYYAFVDLNKLQIKNSRAITNPFSFSYEIPFKNKIAQLDIYSYPFISYYVPVISGLAIISFSIYLLIVMCFIRMKVRSITQIQKDISALSNGDLNHEVHVNGNDEITELGNHLNEMRISLMETIENEINARNTNKELISAMSHDLRTPLTTLKGYLEIIQMEKVDINKRKEYLHRCLDKINEITELSNKMFEYSLVFSSDDLKDIEIVDFSFIIDLLKDHVSYLTLMNYKINLNYVNSNITFNGNKMMMKRIFNNIFSNIVKYADKDKTVFISLEIVQNQINFTFTNNKNNINKVESNHIGLKSVKKMIALHNGETYINEDDEQFMIVIHLPIVNQMHVKRK